MSKALDLLARLFPPDSPEPDWQALAAALSRDLQDAHCIVWIESGIGAPNGASSDALRDRFAAYAGAGEIDYWAASRAPVGTPFAIDIDRVRELPRFARDVLDPLGVRAGRLLGIPLAANGATIVATLCIFPSATAQPGSEALALLEDLAPWLVHAARTTLHLRALSATSSALQRSLDRLRIGVILLDDAHRVVLANRSAVALLEGADGSSFVAANALAPRRDRIQLAVERLLDSRATGAGPARPHVSISRLAHPDEISSFLGATTVVFIPDPATVESELVDPLRKHYGLTPAEARLAALLASDFTLDEAAEHLGLSVGTVRTRLKRLFEKTGTNRQASLVRLLVMGPGLFRDGDGV